MSIDSLQVMGRAITLAKQAGKAVKSNPQVGCVIMNNGRVIGEGYHQVYGQSHAEVNALNSVTDKSLIPGSTAYVTLEPCNHAGKTPPCSQRIIDEKIAHVVIGCLDPTPLVDGKGLQYLKANGIKTTLLDLDECKALIRPFVTNQLLQRPYIIIKYAQSKDGYIGQLDKQINITSMDTNVLTHMWRGEIDGILIGNNTALIDNPSLTTRHYPGDNPLRIVIDYSHKIPKTSKLLSDGLPTLIINGDKSESSDQVKYLKIPKDKLYTDGMRLLHQRGIYKLMIEGGSKTIQGFVDANVWDEARVITSNRNLNEGVPAPQIRGKQVHTLTLSNDKIITLHNA